MLLPGDKEETVVSGDIHHFFRFQITQKQPITDTLEHGYCARNVKWKECGRNERGTNDKCNFGKQKGTEGGNQTVTGGGVNVGEGRGRFNTICTCCKHKKHSGK